MMHFSIGLSQNIANLEAYPNKKQHFHDKYEVKVNEPVIKKKRSRNTTVDDSEPFTIYRCSAPECNKEYNTQTGCIKHTTNKHKKTKEECPPKVLKVTKEEVRDNGVQYNKSPLKGSDGDKKLKSNKIAFKISEPKSRVNSQNTVPVKSHKKLKINPITHQVRSNVAPNKESRNEIVHIQPIQAKKSQKSNTEKEESNNSYVLVFRLVQLGYKDNFYQQMNELLNKLRETANPCAFMTPDAFRINITCMAKDIEDQLVNRIKQSQYYALQITETVDVNNFSILLVLVRYKFSSKIHEDLLLSRCVSQTIDGAEICLLIDAYVSLCNLGWKNCVGISTGCMSKRLKEFKNRVSIKNKKIRFTSNLSDRAAFVQYYISSGLRAELRTVTQIINQHKLTDLRMSSEYDTKFKQIYLQTADLWLAHNNILLRLLESHTSFGLNSDKQLLYLACLTDLFHFFNKAAKKINDTKNVTIFHINDQTKIMIDTLNLYKTECDKHNFEGFPTVEKFVTHPDLKFDIAGQLSKSLKYLMENVSKYLLINDDELNEYEWIRDPFGNKNADQLPEDFTLDDKTKLINLKNDSDMKSKFNRARSLETFWIEACATKHAVIAERALRFLLNFHNSRLLESCFAMFVDIRGKQLTDFNSEESYLRVKISSIRPSFVN